MALLASRDTAMALDQVADICPGRISSRKTSPPLLSHRRRSSDIELFTHRHDRWTANLNALQTNPRVACDQNSRQSLIMPLSTGCHSILASTTTTLPSALESNDHGRLNYTSHCPPSKTLRPPLQSNSLTHTSNGAYSLPKPPFAVDSTTSSPSTTTSTLNSAVTEASPVSSPQSPNSFMQAPFKQTRLNTNLPLEASMDQPGEDVSPVRPSTSASDSAALRKGRNMKNLMINTNGISAKQNIDSRAATKDGLAQRPVTQSGPATTFKPGSLPPVSESAPVSPSFIIPKMPPRRKPSKLGLTIATPESEQKAAVPPTPSFNATFANPRAAALPTQLQTIPQTPAFPPAIQSQSEAKPVPESLFSPVGPPATMSLPVVTGRELRTPGLAPIGGMTLPPFGSVESSPSKRSSPDPERYKPLQNHMGLQRHKSAEQMGESSIVNQTIEHINNIPTHDLPLSQEVKSPSYPEGPACIYPPNVYLYHQPTANEARNFDVVINVAREVTNPFEIEAEEEKARLKAKNTEPVRLQKPNYRSVGVQTELLTDNFPPRTQTADEPPSAASDSSFSSALDRLSISTDEESPPTPKVGKLQPEYLHLPWEHNSKVYEDWYEICQLISDRTKKGKKVLIHCQLGVSRSASLIVAYGIFLNPHLSPDEAREQAKFRSRWIDLNMHFMYELGDFKKLLAKKGVPGADMPRAGLSGQASKPAPLSLSRGKPDTAVLSPVQSVPNTPLSTMSSVPGSAPITGEDGSDGQFARVPDEGLRTPGPSSAPADVTWPLPTKSSSVEGSLTPPVPVLPTERDAGIRLGESQRLPPPLEMPIRGPSPGLKTPGFDMPGGWAATPAMSRPTSMVIPEAHTDSLNAQLAQVSEKVPQQASVSPQEPPSAQSEASETADTKPNRTPSFRRLPRMPSLPSGFANSIGNFFSLNRSASTNSRKSVSAVPANQAGTSNVRGDFNASSGDSAEGSAGDGSAVPGLRKPPSLPTLRTFFPLGASETRSSKPGLSLTLDTIPQSAVGTDDAPNSDAAFAALMSPRAQEFVSNPFHRPVTSHAALASRPVEKSQPRPVSGFASMFGTFGMKRQKSGQSLRDESSAIADDQKDATASSIVDPAPEGLGRKASTGSHQTVVHLERKEAILQDEDVRELMSPGAQERDPRSPPNHGSWGTEERVMRSIDDVL